MSAKENTAKYSLVSHICEPICLYYSHICELSRVKFTFVRKGIVMYERFKKFCEKKGVKPSNALKDLGISNSNAANWKSRNGLPNGQTVIKIADYFGITADEVLGREPISPDQKINLPDDEQAIIEYFRNSDDESKEHILKYIEFLSKQKNVPPEGN